MNPDGTLLRRLTDNVYPIICIDPNLSPDGTSVVMATHQVPAHLNSHVGRSEPTGVVSPTSAWVSIPSTAA